MHNYTKEQRQADFEKVQAIIEQYKPKIDLSHTISTEEFQQRHKNVNAALEKAGFSAGFVFSDESYCGDVPYLGGNVNMMIEQCAGAIGPTGFHLIAGLEGGYVAEQLSPKAGAIVHKAEMLQLADEKYPVAAEKVEDIIAAAAGRSVDKIGKIAILTPRQVIPSSVIQYLEKKFGKKNVVDAQELYYKVKYEKSDMEMTLIKDSTLISDAMVRSMLATIQPGRLETEVASWANFTALQLGAENLGFKTILGTGEANRTLIGQALNRPIQQGDWLHMGASAKRDGLASCTRRSIIVGVPESGWKPDQKYWFDFIEQAYQIGYDKYVEVAEKNLPAKLQEQALVDFFASRSKEVSKKIGKTIQLEMLKPYTGTHNSGYTECQEFYGAITLESEQPLGHQIVTMLDVALRGIGNKWNDVVIPGFDYIVVENTLGKFGKKVECFNSVPPRVQNLQGKGL